MNLVARYNLWMEAVRDLLDRDHAFFPRAAVGELLGQTLDTRAVSWTWAEGGSFGCEFDFDGSIAGWSMTQVPVTEARRMQARHPLLQWFQTTGDPAPTTVGRLPRWVAPPEDFALLVETLGPGGLEQQISIPYRLAPTEHRAFVLARGADDFPAGDVALARRIQPLLDLLDRQVRASQGRRTARAAAAGLTSREVAVLALLADGRTAEAIARRLGISPRTVTCHLQHIYRKLGVADRVRAVVVAQALGLVRNDPTDVPPDPQLADVEAREPLAEVLQGQRLRESGHRWMLLLDDPADPWQPAPSDDAGWECVHQAVEGEDGILTAVWSH